MKRFSLFSCIVAFALQGATDESHLDRLLALARVWATVEYFHPYRSVWRLDWDDAVVEAMPAVKSATTSQELAAVLSRLLSRLDDPVTRVVESQMLPSAPAGSGRASARTTAEGFLIIAIIPPTSPSEIDKHIDALSTAKGLVIDLRAGGGLALDEARLSRMVFAASVVGPAQRRMINSTMTGGMLIEGGNLFKPDPNARDIPVIFAISSRTVVPAFAMALQAAGKARIISEGMPSEDKLVRVVRIKFPREVEVQIRLSELLNSDGSTGFKPDVSVAENALQVALDQARRPPDGGRLSRAASPATAPNRLDWLDVRFDPRGPAGPEYPSHGYRVLAGFRIWTVFQLLDAYRARTRDEWDAILKNFLPRLESAENAIEYHVAVSEMIGQARDSHALAASPVLTKYRGEAPAPAAMRPVEGKLVITRVMTDQTGLEPGDIVIEIDGQGAAGKLRRCMERNPGSTSDASALHCSASLLSGAAGSQVRVSAEGHDGRRKTVTLTRGNTGNPYSPGRGGDVMRILPGKIGYVDLERLPEVRVDEMFEAFKDTQGIVFDLRGYPRFTGWPIAARITDRPSKYAWHRFFPLAVYPDAVIGSSARAMPSFAGVPVMDNRVVQSSYLGLTKAEKWHYGGRTVALIDERAMSSPELTAILLKTANGTVLVGSRTTGATGIRTIFSLPGGIRGSYSSSLIEFADGRAAQGKGVPPDIEVRPTIEGIRAGRDEVLEAALKHLGVGERVHGLAEAR